MLEFHAGDNKAVQLPATKIRIKTVAGPATPASVKAVSKNPVTAWTTRATRIRRRRSVMSAHTPAGKDNKNMGRKTAV